MIRVKQATFEIEIKITKARNWKIKIQLTEIDWPKLKNFNFFKSQSDQLRYDTQMFMHVCKCIINNS